MKSLRNPLKFLVLIFLFSCQEALEIIHPSVFTGEIVLNNDTSAIFHGKVENFTDQPIIESGFIWGVHSGDNNGVKIINQSGNDGLFASQTNYSILPNKTFYVRAYAKTDASTVYGREVSFLGPKGKTNYGKWSTYLSSDLGYSCDYVTTSFSINNITYFLYEDGNVYQFNHDTNNYEIVHSNGISRATFSVVRNGIAYLFSQNSFFKYDPADNTFIKLPEWPAVDRYGTVGFSIGNDLYIGLGAANNNYSKEFWQFNLETNAWRQIKDFPGDYRINAYSFNNNTNGYVGGGFNLINWQGLYPKFNDLWKYNKNRDEWVQKMSLPFKNEELYDLEGTKFRGAGYCFYKNKLYRYNFIFDFWDEMDELKTAGDLCYPHLFVHDDQLFVAETLKDHNGKYIDLWAYAR